MQESQSLVDAIQFAAQMGRLDFVSAMLGGVSAMLAVVALFMAFAGFIGYKQVSSQSRTIAAETAREEAARAVGEYLEKNLPGMLDERLNVVEEPVNDEAAYELSSAQEKGRT